MGPLYGFLPTIAKQLGYSITTYGSMMTVMSIVSTIWIILSGIIVDKFHIIKIVLMTSILGISLMSILFLIVPKVPLESVVEFHCDAKTTKFIVDSEKDMPTIRTNDKTSVIRPSEDDSIVCKVDYSFIIILLYFFVLILVPT